MRKALLWGGQLVFIGLVAYFFWKQLGPTLDDFSKAKLDISVRPAWIVAAAAITILTYGVLIEAWRRVLLGWGQQLHYWPAARIWCLSNLARFIPGRVWSIAGMAVLARQQGVEIWAATGSAIVLNALNMGTGVLIGALLVPQAQTPLALAVSAVLVALALTPFVWPTMGNRLIALFRPGVHLKPVSAAALFAGAVTTLVSWVSYGGAMWMLARGLFDKPGLSLGMATGSFAVAYVLGYVALVVPGGIGVREMVLSTMLAPTMGTGPAVTLTIAARILVTITEAGTGLLGFGLKPASKEPA